MNRFVPTVNQIDLFTLFVALSMCTCEKHLETAQCAKHEDDCSLPAASGDISCVQYLHGFDTIQEKDWCAAMPPVNPFEHS